MPTSPSPAATPRVLAVRFGAMGDLILTTPLLRAIRRRHPEAEITVVTRARWASLLRNNPHLTGVVEWTDGTPLRTLARSLEGSTWTHRLDLHRSLRSRALRLLVGGRWHSYPKGRYARWRLLRTKRDTRSDRRPVAERYFDAARSLDVTPDGGPAEVFVDRAALHAAHMLLQEGGHDTSRTLLALAPGAAHATKRWPLAHWQELARRLGGKGSDLVVVGGPDDAALGEAIREAIPERVTNAAGRTMPLESAALLKQSRLVVAGDTGLMHLATAVGTPVAALFGPTVEAFGFAPYQARAEVLSLDLPCRPCSPHGGPVCPLGHHRCLVDLSPDLVADALRRLPR